MVQLMLRCGCIRSQIWQTLLLAMWLNSPQRWESGKDGLEKVIFEEGQDSCKVARDTRVISKSIRPLPLLAVWAITPSFLCAFSSGNGSSCTAQRCLLQAGSAHHNTRGWSQKGKQETRLLRDCMKHVYDFLTPPSQIWLLPSNMNTKIFPKDSARIGPTVKLQRFSVAIQKKTP